MFRPFLVLSALSLSATANARSPAEIDTTFTASKIVALVQVKESTFPIADGSADYRARSFSAAATMTIIASWKGPYHTGSTLHAVQPQVCGGYSCGTHPFRIGEILIIFVGDYGSGSSCLIPESICPSPSSIVREPEAGSIFKELYILSRAEKPNNRLSGPRINKLPASFSVLKMSDGSRASAQLWR
jgi:hypothetical protein